MKGDREVRTLLRGRRPSPLPFLLVILVGLATVGAVTVMPSSGAPVVAASPAPLDPLSADEIATVFEVVQALEQVPRGRRSSRS